MKHNIRITVVCTLVLFITLVNTPLAFAQIFDSVQISAYGRNLVIDNLGVGTLEFFVAVPPAGLGITNSISARRISNGENCYVDLLPGDEVLLTYANMQVDNVSIVESSEPDYFIIYYEGEAGWLWVNATEIPEFSTIFLVPLFMTVTLFAIIYRRKRTQK